MVVQHAEDGAGGDDARPRWQPVCPLDDLEAGWGVTALVHGQAVAIFRTATDEVFCVGNHDPYARSAGLARGIVGERAGTWFVASPTHRHPFDLRTGRCLDEAGVSVPSYAVRVVDGTVQVGPRQAG